jgi:hypothetical protein
MSETSFAPKFAPLKYVTVDKKSAPPKSRTVPQAFVLLLLKILVLKKQYETVQKIQ